MSHILTSLADFDDPHDAAAIVALINDYAVEPHGGGQALSPDVAAAIVPGLKSIPNAFAILAWDGEQPIGVAICFLGFSTFKARPLVNIHDLSVFHTYRGQGIGTLLLNAVEEYARSRGCCKVTLEVRKENPRAEQLYLRQGYGDPSGFETRFLDKPL